MQLDPPKGLQSLSFVSFSLENLDLPKDVRFIILSQINSFSGVVYPDKCNFLFSFCAKGNEPFSTIRNIKVRDGKLFLVQAEPPTIGSYDWSGFCLLRFSLPSFHPGSLPKHIALDQQGRIFISDVRPSYVRVCSETGSSIKEFPVSYPTALSVDKKSFIYVSTFSSVIAIYDSLFNRKSDLYCSGNDFSLLFSSNLIGFFHGKVLKNFSRPVAMDFDSKNQLFVCGQADGVSSCQVYEDGVFLFEFGNDILVYPTCIKIDGEDKVLIGDEGSNQIEVFDGSGRHLFRFGENLKCIAGIDIDCFDRVFVSDTILQDILVFG